MVHLLSRATPEGSNRALKRHTRENLCEELNTYPDEWEKNVLGETKLP